MAETSSSIRTRWAAIGAAVAVTLGAAGIGSYNLVNADVSSGDRPVYIPINPCRLLDTRSGPENVGPLSDPLAPDKTETIIAHGSNGECTGPSEIPTDATALAMNVTALNATSQTFLTFWGEGANPGTANLNPAPGQPPTPNAVNTPLSAGAFNIYNELGNVNVVIDVNGYYAPHDHDDRYPLATDVYTKTEVDGKFLQIPERVTIAPNAFGPWNETVDFARSDVVTLNAGTVCFYAPVDLPEGATIESVTAIVSVQNANDSVTVRLGRTLWADGTSIAAAQPGWIADEVVQVLQGATLTHVTDDTIGDLVLTNGDDAVVDNDTYMYNAHICLTADHQIWGYVIELA